MAGPPHGDYRSPCTIRFTSALACSHPPNGGNRSFFKQKPSPPIYGSGPRTKREPWRLEQRQREQIRGGMHHKFVSHPPFGDAGSLVFLCCSVGTTTRRND